MTSIQVIFLVDSAQTQTDRFPEGAPSSGENPEFSQKESQPMFQDRDKNGYEGLR